MLTLRVDESINDRSGLYIVAGFLGSEEQWQRYEEFWKKARRPLDSLHLSRLRLNSPNAPLRCEKVLQRLGAVPGECGLQPVAGSICREDYIHQVSGTALQPLMEGYVLAILTLLDGVATHIPLEESLSVVFEENTAQAALREKAMCFWKEGHIRPSGRSVLEQWSAIPKGTLTEASDYLCYALQQREADEASQKARLTAPILAEEPIWNHTGQEEVGRWLNELRRTRTRTGDLRETRLIGCDRT